jgi:hypothetical protein
MRRWFNRGLRARVVSLAVLATVMASPASAGTILPTGWTESNGQLTYIGIFPDPYGNAWWSVSIKEQQPTTMGLGYVDLGDAPEAPFLPGQCASTPDKTEWTCGMAGGASGEPFFITGTEGDDVYREMTCSGGAPWIPAGSVCPRTFKVNLYGGKDEVRLYPHLPMHAVEINGGAGNDNVLVGNEGQADGRIDAGEGDDYIDTSTGTGPWVIVCGPGKDTVNPGPLDQVSADCEKRGTGEEVEPTPTVVTTDYSLAGVCGYKKGTKVPRCYLMFGAGLIRALKSNEHEIVSDARSVVALATAKFVADAAGRVAKKQARNQLITYSVKKVVGELEGKAVGAGLSGFSLGQALAKTTSLAIIATRWSHLEAKGYPHKCFLVQLTYEKQKPKLALDPIFSFVRGWDDENPPSYRGITTSAGHWEAKSGKSETLPLFCSGAKATAVSMRSSGGQTALLSGPLMRFSIAYDAR